ncbi:hypothetical protein [Limnohabitans sp.]|uniref:hypothetical protein n=1 Tax=Limnohabitans sp. TaxID=1907725 RepID=UPI003342C4A9
MSTFSGKHVMPRLHGVAFVCGLTGHYNTLVVTLVRMVQQELDFISDCAPPVVFNTRNTSVADITLLRHLVTRGREGGAAHAEDLLRHRTALLLQLVNGDWKHPRLQHFCRGRQCCRSREDAVHRITQALMDSCLSQLAAVQLAASRWYTYEPAMTHVALGCLCHNVLGRAFACAFPDTPARKKRGNDDDDDWHARSIKKTRQANAYLSSIDNHKSLAIALVTTAPLDHLSARLQHLDAQQAWSLMNLCDSRTGPLVAAQVELASILYPKQCNGEPALPALMHHFGSVLRSELRPKVVALCAQLWARLEVTYFNWPWRLLGLVDPFLPDQSKRELALAFWHAPACDLDPEFSEGLRQSVGGPDALLGEPVLGLLRRLARCGRSSNMGVEGLLAQIKSSVRARKTPTVERLCFAGHLATLMQDHLVVGMPDLRTAKALRRQALAAHAPIKANTAHRRALKKRGSARPHLQWCNARVAAWIDENPGASADAVTAQRRQAAAEWRNMSQVERGDACLAAAARAPRSCKSNITVTVPPSPPLWRISDERWPLSEYVLNSNSLSVVRWCSLTDPMVVWQMWALQTGPSGCAASAEKIMWSGMLETSQRRRTSWFGCHATSRTMEFAGQWMKESTRM